MKFDTIRLAQNTVLTIVMIFSLAYWFHGYSFLESLSRASFWASLVNIAYAYCYAYVKGLI